MKQIILKDGRVLCETTVLYPKQTISEMKKSGYKVKEVQDNESKRSQ